MGARFRSLRRFVAHACAGIAIALAAAPIPASCLAREIESLSAGPPRSVIDGKLPPAQFQEVEARRLANPRLVWLNVPLLREMGFHVPDPITPEFTERVLETIAWVTPDHRTKPGELLNRVRKFWTDYYGGNEIGKNTGSARAGSSGEIQNKGFGETRNANGLKADQTARSSPHEAMKDAIWGEVLQRELPFGGNRLVAVTDRGVTTPGGTPEFVETRLDPVRMGHFMERLGFYDMIDRARNQESLRHLSRALPAPAGGFPAAATEGERILRGLEEYSRRVGAQYGSMHMKRLFHGATSQSNIEISGALLDFGTASALPAWEPATFLERNAPFGDTAEIRKMLISSLALKTRFPEEMKTELRAALGKLERERGVKPGVFRALVEKLGWERGIERVMLQAFDASYASRRRAEALALVGIPEEIVSKLGDRHRAVADWLVGLTDEQLRRSRGTIHLQHTTALKGIPPGSFQTLSEALASEGAYDAGAIGRSIVRIGSKGAAPKGAAAAAKGLEALFADATAEAAKEGVSPDAFRKLVAANSRFKNRPMPELYLPELRKTTEAATQAYLAGDRAAIGRGIDGVVASSTRTVPGLAWHQAPVEHGGRVEVFDAKSNCNPLFGHLVSHSGSH